MKKNNIILLVVALVALLSIIAFAAYAYFSVGNLNTSNITNLTATSERNNMVFDTLGGAMLLNVTASNMSEANNNTIASQNSTTLTVNFQANTDYSMVCTYDIVYEWTSSDKYQAHTSGVTQNEFTIQASLANNAHVSQGSNSIASETDLSTAVGNQTSAIVVTGAQIDSTGTSTSTAIWTITSKFYNVNANQNTLADKTYEGRFKVANISCIQGEVTIPGPTSYWFPTTLSTWNNNTNQYEPNYTYPATGGTVQSSGTATGHNVYIGQDNSKYYVCATISGHEVCLSQPYTQYGLFGHTLKTSLTSAQQTSAKQAIYQAFIDAGISVDIDNDCSEYDQDAYCGVGDLFCDVDFSGYVNCGDGYESVHCGVDPAGRPYCES